MDLLALPSNDNDPESCPAMRAFIVDRLEDLHRRKMHCDAEIRLYERDGGTSEWGNYLCLRARVLAGAIVKFERMLHGSWQEAFHARRDLL